MATLEPSPSVPVLPLVPDCIQPGGGRCFRIELAWGRWRRWYLRHFRPGYVREMLARRQGSCLHCTHDIIDPRDLKPWRNACGFWFRPEDDRFAWRGRLGLARVGLAEVICFSLLFACAIALSLAGGWAIHPALYALALIVLPFWLFVLSFFRDPERIIPRDADVLVSPADGKVTHVGLAESPEFQGQIALRVSIFLSVFNVHVNRSPRAARVEKVRYFPGEFLDARHGDCGGAQRATLDRDGGYRHWPADPRKADLGSHRSPHRLLVEAGGCSSGGRALRHDQIRLAHGSLAACGLRLGAVRQGRRHGPGRKLCAATEKEHFRLTLRGSASLLKKSV